MPLSRTDVQALRLDSECDRLSLPHAMASVQHRLGQLDTHSWRHEAQLQKLRAALVFSFRSTRRD